MHKQKKEMDSKKYKCLDLGGMPLSEQWKLESEIRKYKYQVKIRLSSGRIRYLHCNEPGPIELYAKGINAKIIWVKKL